jgi:quercetin dioxygenase-like cupin family protein
MQRVIDNPRSGERIVISQSGADTDGRLLAFDLFLQPGAHVPAGHSHPRQEERFTVVAGCIRFRLERQTVLAPRGTTLSVPPGTAHWFGNSGPDVAQLHVEVRPALRMQELLETTAHRSTTPEAWWSRLIDLALIPLDFQPELGVPHVPARLITAVLTPLAWLRQRPRLVL